MRLFAALLSVPLVLFGQAVTFNKQIAPIVYSNCSSCHRPGEAAPFPLLSYKDVAEKGRIIASAISSHLMPPWKAEPASYKYRDERRLSEEQIALIQEWVRQGMPEGKAEDRPEPPKFSSGWMLGEPDMVVEMPAGYHVPADGPDIYRNIAIPLGLTEDKWVTAIDMRPSARSVVHHVLYFGDPAGKIHERPSDGPEPGFNGMRAGGASVPLGGFAVGAQPHFYPDGLAHEVVKGSDLVVQYHFHPTGKPEIEKSRIALYFAKKPPERRLISVQLPPDYSLFEGLDIPPGDKDYVVRDSYTLPVDMDAVGVGAHAHYLGKKLTLTATLPNGDVKTMLSIADWDFAWQDRYFFEHSVTLPKGTRLDAEVHWDNSAENPHNPSNPPIRISWGEQSKDEMGSVSLIGVPHVESDYAAFRADLEKRTRLAARQRIMQDPSFAAKLRELLGAMKFLAVFALSAVLHPAVRVKDVAGVERTPLKVAPDHVAAVFFVAHDCPISNYYSHEIRRICDGYTARGLSCSLVYVEPNLSDADAAKHAAEYGHGDYPKIVDRKHELVAAAGATITPQAVLIQSDETIAYRGRIDNFYAALGRPRRVVTEHDLRDALDAVFSGRPVAKPETQAVGCYIPDLSAYSH